MSNAEQREGKLSVSEAVRAKRAVRAYSAEPVPDEVIRAILNAGRRAQSSKNDQPWTFIVVTEREQLQRLSTAGTYTAHMPSSAFTVVLVAPVVPSARLDFTRSGSIESSHSFVPAATNDCSGVIVTPPS